MTEHILIPRWAIEQLVAFAAATEYELSLNEAADLLWDLDSEIGIKFDEEAQNLTADIDPMILAQECRKYVGPKPRELSRIFGAYKEQLSTKDYQSFLVFLEKDGVWRQSHPTDPRGLDVVVTATNIIIDEECLTWQFPWRDIIMFEEAAKHLKLDAKANRRWIDNQVIQGVLSRRQRPATSSMTSTQPPYPPPEEKLYACPRCIWHDEWRITYEQRWFCA